MTNNLPKIYSDFKSDYRDNPDYIIDFYSRHSLFLNNIGTIRNKEDLGIYIELTWQYLNATYQKGRFNDTIDLADKSIIFIDNEIEKLNAKDQKDNWYYGILLLNGMSKYNLRDYKKATPIFEQLVQTDNKNDNFKNWLNYSTYGESIWLVNTINIVCGLMCAIGILFRDYMPNFFIRFSILGVGILGLTANWGYEYYVKRSFRKTTKQ